MPEQTSTGPDDAEEPFPPTINRVVSYNVRRARVAQGKTQEQAARSLGVQTGRPWSKASYSAAERAAHGGRVKEWSANELVALAITFGLPVSYFLLPPEEDAKDVPPEWAEGTSIYTTTDPRAVNAGRIHHGVGRRTLWDVACELLQPRLSELMVGRIDIEAQARNLAWDPPQVRQLPHKALAAHLDRLLSGDEDVLRQVLKQVQDGRSVVDAIYETAPGDDLSEGESDGRDGES